MTLTDKAKESYLDLRGIPCPLNFVRCTLALEKLSYEGVLKVDLDRGEPEETVLIGVREKGYQVDIDFNKDEYVTLLISSEKR